MIHLILLLSSAVFATDTTPWCTDIGGEYQIANGRGHHTGSAVTVQADAASDTGCTFTVVVPDLDIHDFVTVSGNSLLVTSGEYIGFTGEVDGRGLILWNNGYYYWPSHLPEEELPVDCLHPFSLHCYETCADCSPCAEDHTLPGCDECHHCEQCADYVPCLEAVADKPECVEPEAFSCLRECRECTACDEFSHCQNLISTFEEHCVSVKAVECLDQCERCIPCANGEEGADCSGCEECERCAGFLDCAERIHEVPEDQRHCINEDAIHCLHDCGHCSECSDRMHCLDAFPNEETSHDGEDLCELNCVFHFPENTPCEDICDGCWNHADCLDQGFDTVDLCYATHCSEDESGPNMCDGDAFMNLLEDLSPELQESCHHAMGEADDPAQDCPCFNNLLDVVSLTLDIDCFWSEDSKETLREEAERMCRHTPPSPNMCDGDAFMNLLEDMSPELQESCHHAMGETDDPAQDCPCFNNLLDVVSLTLDIDCFWSEDSKETLREEAERMCRHTPTPPAEDFGYEIEVSNYPCATHGSEADSINQVYRMVEMGANSQRIFQGTKDQRWWIYFDESCGGHEPRWFLTPEAPDFDAVENLQHSQHGCTNTLQFHEIHFPSSVSVSHFFCDSVSSWENEFTQNGWEVHVDFRSAAPMQPTCIDDDNYFQQMTALLQVDELSSCADLSNDDLRAQWCPQTDGACGCQCRDYPVTRCMEFREGNYQVNDANTGEVVAHFKMWKDGCHGGMSMESSTDRMEMSLNFFMNRVETIDADGTLFVGTPTATGGLIFNDIYDFNFIDCMIIYSGNYELKTQDTQEHVGHHFMNQDGCHAVSTYRDDEPDKQHQSTFVLTHETLSGDVNGEFIEGERGADGEIQWSNGYVSYPLWEDDHECREDGHMFYEYVRNIVPEHQHHRVSDMLQKIEWEGCHVLRMDFEMKENFCLFHPEVRDACSCVCDHDDTEPRHVCSPDQFESWMARDLGHECQLLFMSGLAEEHRPACDCMRSIPHEAAEELFGSHCVFSSWSDRSFYRIWEDCQHHY